jgi:prepilin-type processing-associated H-X9-DG protein
MPTPLICSHCGATTEATAEHAGKTFVCAHCGKTVSKPSGKPWLSGIEFIFIIIGIDIVGVLISLWLPSIQAAREASRRAQCVDNLKQIGQAMQKYHQANGNFPPAFLAEKDGTPMHSWRVLILPFPGTRERELYAKYRFDEPWNSPHNKAMAEPMPPVYRCPSEATDAPQTSYAMLVGPHTVTDGPTPRRTGDIADGLSGTILVAEAAKAGIPWMEPRDLDAEKMEFCINATSNNLMQDAREISGRHHGGANVLFCDGSVQILSSQSLDANDLKALTTIDGGETVPAWKLRN